MQVDKNKVVFFDYTLTDEKGAIIDQSKDDNPLGYVHGFENIVPGLEEALAGKKAGDQLKVSLPPEKGYGTRDESLVARVDRQQFDQGANIKVGMQVQAQSDQGTQIFFVTGINDDTVTLDGNHPLAGIELNFDVQIKEIRNASDEEIKRGGLQADCCSENNNCCD